MTIRRLAAADLPAAAELEKACFSVPWTEGMLAGELSEGLYLGAFEDDKLVGYCGMRGVLDEGYINNVAVLPAFRRRGIARALLTELEKHTEGLAFLTLEVRESNTAAQALYISLGYLPVGRRPRYYERPVEDALLMTKYFTGR